MFVQMFTRTSTLNCQAFGDVAIHSATFDLSQPLGLKLPPDGSSKILHVEAGGQAERAGVLAGYRILSVDDLPVSACENMD